MLTLISLLICSKVPSTQAFQSTLKSDTRQAYQYVIRGDQRQSRGLQEEAIIEYDKALKIFEGLDFLSNRDALFAAQVYRKSGDVLVVQQSSSDWIKALHHYKRALTIADMHGSQDGIYEAVNGICDISFRLGNLEEARFFCQFKHNIAWTMSSP